MKRTVAVVLVAVLTAVLFGVDRPMWAAQNSTPPPTSPRLLVEKQLAGIKVNSPVKVRRLDGTFVQGLLAEKRPDDISVDVYRKRSFRRPQFVRRDTLGLSEIADVKKLLSDNQRAAVAAGVTAGVLLGTCAIALSQYHASMTPADPSAQPDHAPPPSSTATESTNGVSRPSQ